MIRRLTRVLPGVAVGCACAGAWLSWATPAAALPAGVRLLDAGPSRVTIVVEAPEPRWTAEASSGDLQLDLAGYDVDGEPGQPALPARVVLVAVPPSGEVTVEAHVSDTEWRDGRMATVPRADATGSSEALPARVPRVPAGGEIAPSTPARLLEVTWMRDQRVARVRVCPVSIDAAQGRIGLHRRIEVEVRFVATPGTPAAARPDGFESVYRGTIANYEQGRGWRQPPRGGAGAPYAQMGSGAVPAHVSDVPTTSLFAGRNWVKISIPRTGFYRVFFGQLRNSRLFGGSDSVSVDSLRLFVWPGVPVLPESSYCDSCDYREVAIGIVDAPNSTDGSVGKFDNNDNDYFYFYALGASDWTDLYVGPQDAPQADTVFMNHPYESRNFYYLTIATSDTPVPLAPKRIITASGALADTVGALRPSTFPARVHAEQDEDFRPDLTPVTGVNPDGSFARRPEFWEKWFWAGITLGAPTFSQTVDLPGIDPSQPARVRLRAWGVTSGVTKDAGVFDHHLDLSFGTTAFATGTWNGASPFTFDSTVTGLTDAGTTLLARVTPKAIANRSADEIEIAWFDVFYRRRFEPVADELFFESDRAGGKIVYDVGPFSLSPNAQPRVFDVTDPFSPVEILSAEYTYTTAGWRLQFNRVESGRHRYWVVPDSAGRIVRPPNSDVFDAPGGALNLTNLRSGLAADYLVIYYDPFATAAEELVAWRRSHLPLVGVPPEYPALAVPVSALYDQFSGGRMDPAAIRNFLRAAYFNWSERPTFVTFLGDASSDFKNLTGAAPAGQPGALVPSYEGGFDRILLRQYATDDWLLNVNDAIRVVPDFLGGRIPAGDAASALAYVRDKLIFYEQSAPLDEWRGRVMLVGDDNEQGSRPDVIYWGHMEQTVALDTEAIPPEVDRAYVYLHTYPDGTGDTKPLAKADFLRFVNEGVVLSNYIGHGSPVKLADESVMILADVDQLTNRQRPTILVAASCDVGKFNSYDFQGLGERMLFHPNGGAVAVVSATEVALSTQNARLNLDLYESLFTRDPVTGQFEATLAEGLAVAKTGATNSQKYQVMGDAAIRPALPRIWVEAAVRDLGGNPITQAQRGQTVVVSGQVFDRPGGTPLTLEGLAHVLVEDSAPVDTVPNCFDPCLGYPYRASPVFRGDVSVSAGRFEGRFVMPMDARLGVRGRARATVDLASGSARMDGFGSRAFEVLSGAPPANDTEGPRVQLSFVGGATRVRPDATLRVDLFDDSGILITDKSPQNGIIVTVDGSSTQRYDVTSSFRYAANSYQSGTAFFQLPGLEAGAHRIEVSAADNLAAGITASEHRNRAGIDFEVAVSPALEVKRAMLFPNPVRSGAAGGGGAFVVDAPGDSFNVVVKIYTVAGRLVRVLRSQGGLAQTQIPWDGRDAEGDPLARGVYLFNVQAFPRLPGGGSGGARATAEGRFVVSGP